MLEQLDELTAGILKLTEKDAKVTACIPITRKYQLIRLPAHLFNTPDVQTAWEHISHLVATISDDEILGQLEAFIPDQWFVWAKLVEDSDMITPQVREACHNMLETIDIVSGFLVEACSRNLLDRQSELWEDVWNHIDNIMDRLKTFSKLALIGFPEIYLTSSYIKDSNELKEGCMEYEYGDIIWNCCYLWSILLDIGLNYGRTDEFVGAY